MSGIGGRQTSVSVQPAIGVAGDFADTNPRATVNAGAGGLVAGPNGATIGRFAWATYQYADNDNAPALVNSFGQGQVTGFVAREQQGLITTYLADSSMVVAPGFQTTLWSAGSFLAKNDDTVQALNQGTVYADLATGKILASAHTASFTGSIAAESASFTGSITGNLLTVTAVASGAIVPGAIMGTAGGVAAATDIVAQLSGSTGGVGTYALSIPEQTVPSNNLTASYGLLTASAVAAGTIEVGGILTGTGGGGVAAGSVITGEGTGAGNTGTYYVNNTQTVTSTSSLSSTTTVATKFVFENSALPGEIAKISSHLQG